MNSRAFDFSDTKPDAADLEGSDALCYLGRSRPTTAYLDDLARHRVPFTFIFETDPNRSQGGWNNGILDAQVGEQRANEVNYPAGDPIVVVVSDGSKFDPSSGGDRIADYAQAWATQCSRPIFFYGNRYACDAAIGGASRVPGAKLIAGPHRDGAWIPVPWGADARRDLLGQEANIASPIPGTDLNTVYNEYRSASGDDMTPEETDAYIFGPTEFGFSRFEAHCLDYLFKDTAFGLSRVDAEVAEYLKAHPPTGQPGPPGPPSPPVDLSGVRAGLEAMKAGIEQAIAALPTR